MTFKKLESLYKKIDLNLIKNDLYAGNGFYIQEFTTDEYLFIGKKLEDVENWYNNALILKERLSNGIDGFHIKVIEH